MQFWAPDDGRKNRLKHVERLTEINKLRNVASCWLYSAVMYVVCRDMYVVCRDVYVVCRDMYVVCRDMYVVCRDMYVACRDMFIYLE